jgi:hypothetical protein
LGLDLTPCMSNFKDFIEENLAAFDETELELLAAQYKLPVDDDEDGNDNDEDDDDDDDDEEEEDDNYDDNDDEERAIQLIAPFKSAPMYYEDDDDDDEDEDSKNTIIDNVNDHEATIAMMYVADNDEATLAMLSVAHDHDATAFSGVVIPARLRKGKNFRQSTLDAAFRNNSSAQKKQKTRI